MAKKIGVVAGGLVLLVAWSAAPAVAARVVFKSAMSCSGAYSGGGGVATIKDTGDLIINLAGLPSTAAAECHLFCLCSGNTSAVFAAPCAADANGKMKVTFSGAAAGIACPCPAVEVFDGGDCVTGF